jgi:hypothetical protein
MKFKVDRIISIATLLASLVAIVLVLRKPAPVAPPLPPADIAEHAQAFDQKMSDFEQSVQQSSAPSVSLTGSTSQSFSPESNPKPEVRITSDEISAVLAQSLGNTGELTPDSNIGPGQPTIKNQSVNFDGDTVHGQFLTEVAGKDVWITVSGHIGEQNGYATFEPTEFKVGDLNVPVSLVNPALQKKLTEERDRLKLPDTVGGLRVENSELVMQGK